MHGIVSAHSPRISTFACAPARLLRKAPEASSLRLYSIYPIPILSSLRLHPCVSSYTSMRDGHRSPTDAAREGSEHSHLNPCVRRSPGRPCCTSGTIVENILNIPGLKPNITHAGRVRDEHGSVRDGSLSSPTKRRSRESSITVRPCGTLAGSVLELRMHISVARIDELLLHMVCYLGRRLRHDDCLNVKSILPRQRAERQGGSESAGHESGRGQA